MTNQLARVRGATGALALVIAFGVFIPGVAASASAAPAQDEPTLAIDGTEAGDSVELTATLSSAEGDPLAQKTVAFHFSSTVFGPGRLFPLGSARTDTSGIARLTLGADSEHLYVPTNNGPQEFVASYAAPEAGLVRSKTTVNVTVARSAYEAAPPKPLAGMGRALVGVLFIIVAGVWLTLFTLVVRVRHACRGLEQPTISSI